MAAITAGWDDARACFTSVAAVPSPAIQTILDGFEARIAALEVSSPPSPGYTFVGPAPLLGEGYYLSGDQEVTRSLASGAAGEAAANTVGVYNGAPGKLVTDDGVEVPMRLEPGLTGGDAPQAGKPIYTSWTTAGLFTTKEPAALSGHYAVVRGECADASAYDDLDLTGSPVQALLKKPPIYGPV